MSIILGIDPGSRITGYGIIQIRGNQYDYVGSGCIRITEDALSDRLHQIFTGIRDVIAEFNPNEVGIEEVFFHQNPNTALKLGQARGAAIVAAAANALPVAEYSARQIKQSVVGYGAAKKEQVQHMVRCLLNMREEVAVDAADALAVAITHANRTNGVAALLKTVKLRRGRMR